MHWSLRQCDYGDKMKEDNFAARVAKKVNKEFSAMEKSDYENEPYYAHPTFFIKNLSEYIQLVTSIASINKDDLPGETVIFRGIADSEYDLSPGLVRLKNVEENTEKELINDFLTHRPDAFSGLTDFDILAKMQHYGLPTRLLDFSINPLVALYFACESRMSKNGRILCHNTFLQNDSEAYISEICTAAIRKNFEENFLVDDYLCNENLTLSKYLARTYIYNETTVVRPKYWNQRIANQAGVFMIFSNNLVDRYKRALINSEEMDVSKAIEQYGRGKIDEEIIREALLKEPIDYYKKDGNNYLSSECFKRMYNSYRIEEHEEGYWDKIKKYFENRFKISCELKPLDADIIKDGFCSIIVDSKSKKKILRELSYVGIGADYIYPELEYTAKEIKRRFE